MPVSAQPCGSRAGFFVARLFTAVLGRSRALGTAPYDLVEDRVHRTPNIEPRTIVSNRFDTNSKICLIAGGITKYLDTGVILLYVVEAFR